ncbi:MAG: D-alanyl-D-alanine carboxypeptidase [Clostridia bacterium]|nr:D-alanyl-D-alanine carboxypeptidase [Clostridia bacterium]
MRKIKLTAAILCAASLLAATANAADVGMVDISVSAESAIVIEASTGRVVYEKDADTRRPMASTTKIMTALVALEQTDLAREVSVAGEAVGVEGSSVYLETGDKLKMEDLVYALLLESANDAAAAIAIDVAGSVEGFAELMNAKAAELGLTNTHFTNPHGLDSEEHYTTARDLATLAAHALQNETFRRIVSTYRYTIPMGDETRHLLNHNKMLKLYDGAIGVKTGYTRRSGRCLVSAAERDGMTLVAVTLNAPDDWNDHTAMLNAGFDSLEPVQLIADQESVFISPCIGSTNGEVTIQSGEGLTVILPKGTHDIRRVINMPRYFWAPVREGDEVGEIVFYDGQTELGRVGLYAAETVERVTYKQGILEQIFGK